MAEDAEPRLTGPEQAEWLNRLARDHDNLRAAGDSARAAPGGAEAEMRLAGALWRFWHVRGYLSEGRQRFEAALAREDDVPTAVRAQALGSAGILTWAQGDYGAAQELCEASLTLWRLLGNRTKEAAALNTLALVAENKKDFATARLWYEQSLAIFEETNDLGRAAILLGNLGGLAIAERSIGKATELYQRGLALHRSQGDESGIGSATYNLVRSPRGKAIRTPPSRSSAKASQSA